MVPSLRMEGIEHPFRDQKQIVRFSAGFRTASNAPAWHQIFSRRARRCCVSLVSWRSLPGRPCASRSSPRLEPRAPPSPWPPVALWPLRTHRSLRLAAHDTQHHDALFSNTSQLRASTESPPRTPGRPATSPRTAPSLGQCAPAAPCELLMRAELGTVATRSPRHRNLAARARARGIGVGWWACTCYCVLLDVHLPAHAPPRVWWQVVRQTPWRCWQWVVSR